MAKQLDCVLQLFTATRLLRVEDNKERVHIADLFKSSHHFFNVLSVTILRVPDARGVKDDVGVFTVFVSPSHHHTGKLISLRF